jgi:hypothetical protein
MKYIKGCLIALILFIVSLVIIYFLFKNSVVNNLEIYSNNVKQNWSKYVENLKARNVELAQQNFKNDSLNYYWNKAKSISASHCSEELEFNEYKINQFVLSDSLVTNVNDKINLSLDNYNESVRAYNVYAITFPNFFILKKTQFPQNFKYFDYRYGVDNTEAKNKKGKLPDWMKEGI